MESNSDNSYQIKEKEKLVSQNSDVLADIISISSSSPSDCEEQQPSLITVKKPSWSLLQTSTIKISTHKTNSPWSNDFEEQTDNQKSRKFQGSRLIDAGLDNTSTSSNTDLEVGV